MSMKTGVTHAQFLRALASSYRRQSRWRLGSGDSEGAAQDLATADRLARISMALEMSGHDEPEEQAA